MEKFLSVVFLCVCLTAHCYAQSRADKLMEFLKIVQDCKKAFPSVSDERIMAVIKRNSLPQTRDEKCMASCVLERGNLVTNGEINIPAWNELHYAKYRDPAVAELATEAEKMCKGRVPKQTDKCELAFKVVECIFGYTQSMNLPSPL